jgi:hypothetical protein
MPPEENNAFLLIALENDPGVGEEDDAGDGVSRGTAFFSDGDAGVEEIWRLWLSHRSDTEQEGVVREWGFVLWDQERLHKVHHLLPPWITATPSEVFPLDKRMTMMNESWKARTEIYRRGGRDYWSKDDMSRVVWPEGRSLETRESSSAFALGLLAEAKILWRTDFTVISKQEK